MSSPPKFNETVSWYDDNAFDYWEKTRNMDLSDSYRRFLRLLPKDGEILDLGCGPGRDSIEFQVCGFHTFGVDASPEMVKLYEQNVGARAQLARIEEIDFVERFDGIWAAASLLHVRRADLPDAFRRCSMALKPGGAWYLSFKLGDGDRVVDRKLFTDLEFQELAVLLRHEPNLHLHEEWASSANSSDGNPTDWLNAIVIKEQ